MRKQLLAATAMMAMASATTGLNLDEPVPFTSQGRYRGGGRIYHDGGRKKRTYKATNQRKRRKIIRQNPSLLRRKANRK